MTVVGVVRGRLYSSLHESESFIILQQRGWDVARLVEQRTVTPLTEVRFPSAARDFLPRVNFQCRLSFGVHTPLCAVACTITCTHVRSYSPCQGSMDGNTNVLSTPYGDKIIKLMSVIAQRKEEEEEELMLQQTTD